MSTTIKHVFERDDVSKATAGKKKTVSLKKVNVQKRYLLNNMKKLDVCFKGENPALKCSYKTFTFHAVFPTVAARAICLRRSHINIQYLAIALCKSKVIATSDLTRYLEVKYAI